IPPYGSYSDIMDTGQWHLAVYISKVGFGAWLLPDATLGRMPRVIAQKSWQPSEEGLLGRIEDAVYDNPTVLDDFSSDIIVECDRQLWLPSELYPSDEDCAEAYASIYGGDILDVMVNDASKEKCVFMLTPGLKSFMQRSFPGARIWSQQILLKEAASPPYESFKCLIDIRETSADFIVFSRGELICASTHQWKTGADIAYTLFNTLHTFDAPAADTEVVFSGRRELRQDIGKTLIPYFKSISQKNHDLDGKEIPTAVYLAINRKKKYAHYTR
ncbi:MAG: DUF3822 family protein, partial [Muribaculaceae bacterium]|nr:DUF3822 family protein [Muribaculaceae bacterium]